MKSSPQFECVECGYQSPKMYGRCPQCQNWNSMVPVESPDPVGGGGALRTGSPAAAVPLSRIEGGEQQRVLTGITEFDRVLGGGLVPASVILIGGEPGVGKSTLLLEVAGKLAGPDRKVLYYSGEESAMQIKLRADRIGVSSEQVLLVTRGTIEEIQALAEAERPGCLIIDSIQTLPALRPSMSTGTATQLRGLTAILVEMAKRLDLTTFIIGHITKEGQLAGPKTLEHMVDAVLTFHGDVQSDIRILRAEKNRHGPVDEVGIFQMTAGGLTSVQDPSHLFLTHRRGAEPGIAVFPALTGQRAILVEIQALVCDSPFVGNPRRIAIGFDNYRLAMLISIIEKKLRLPFYKSDVFLNVAGGMDLREPAADLAVCAALVSSVRNDAVPLGTSFVGEVGLTGEVRPVSQFEARFKETHRQKLRRIGLSVHQQPLPEARGLEIVPLETVRDLPSLLQTRSEKTTNSGRQLG